MGNPTRATSRRSSPNSSAGNRRPAVSIIVVTVNTPRLTRACLESVRRYTTVPYELIVVNNSTAATIRRCLTAFPGVRLIQNHGNHGFAIAANQGARAARAPYLCFLNSDTLVPPRWLERLLAIARRPGVGAVGPTANKELPCEEYGYPYDWPPPGLSADEPTVQLTDEAVQRWFNGRVERVPWLSGFCFLMPRRLTARVGLFDPQFFFGWEDVDYSLRLRLQGYRLLRAQSVFVYHQWGASTRPGRRQWLARRSYQQLLAKWGARFRTSFTDYRDLFVAVSRAVGR